MNHAAITTKRLALVLTLVFAAVGCKASDPVELQSALQSTTRQAPAQREVTIVIALSAVAPAWVFGHAGIAIDGQFYDYGPDRTDRFQRIQSLRSPAGPWWDDPQQAGYTDHQLNDVLSRLGQEVHPEGSLIVVATFSVTAEEAEQYEEYWQKLYHEMRQDQRTYSLLGEQCASIIAASLLHSEDASAEQSIPPVPHRLRGMSPTMLYRFLHRHVRHSAGPESGQPIEFEIYRLQNGQFVEHQPNLDWSSFGLTPPVRLHMGVIRLKNLAEKAVIGQARR